MKAKTADVRKKITHELIQEVVTVSSAVYLDVISIEAANQRLHERVENCVQEYGLPSALEGIRLAMEALEKSAPDGNLTFHKKNEQDLVVPVICAGIAENFATCTDN